MYWMVSTRLAKPSPGLATSTVGCELRRRIETAGIQAHAEGGLQQLGIVRRLRQRQIELLGAGVVVMILLGDARGEVAAAERDRRRRRPVALGLCRPRLGGRRGLLSSSSDRQAEQQHRRQEREGIRSHGDHILG
jgi:hypothetical protein